MSDRAALPKQTEPPNQEWRTPGPFVDLIRREFGPFVLDAAADHDNHLAPAYLTVEGLWRSDENGRISAGDGLSLPWASVGGLTWCNPPYGRDLPKWVAQGRQAARDGATTIMLIPPSRNAAWWAEMVEGVAAEVRYLIGRLQFEAPPGRETKDRNRYDSALVIFRPRYEARRAGAHSYSWDWRRELRP